MNHTEIKAARQALGLSLSQFAAVLDTDPTTTRRLEMDPRHSTARAPAPRMVRLVRAYLDGYRPNDWPEGAA
jgi:DNA-binding transcriptional regulator YiaG